MTPSINRREALARVALLLGGTLVNPDLFLRAGETPRPAGADSGFAQDDVALMAEIADTILPETSTPGAKAAGVGPFMAMMLADCYTLSDQQVVRAGLAALNREFQAQQGTDFIRGSAESRTAFLQAIDTVHRKRSEQDLYRGYRILKELTLLGYFTSEIGCTQALRYVSVPGRYDGCVPYKKGDRAWATP